MGLGGLDTDERPITGDQQRRLGPADRALRKGRRRLRIRRFTAAGAAVQSVSALVGAMGVVRQASREDVVLTSPAAPTSFNPLVRYAEFGWHPEKLPERSFRAETRAFIMGAGSRHKVNKFHSPLTRSHKRPVDPGRAESNGAPLTEPTPWGSRGESREA